LKHWHNPVCLSSPESRERLPEPKDVMLGILGASSALAGLLLVFGGFLFAQAASFPSDTDERITGKFEKVGRLSVWTFLAFLIICVLCTVWLLHPQELIYWISAWMFLISVMATGVYGLLAYYRYL
jgi:hypothetical protein